MCTPLYSPFFPLPLNALEIAMFMEVAGIMKNTTLDLKVKKKKFYRSIKQIIGKNLQMQCLTLFQTIKKNIVIKATNYGSIIVEGKQPKS